MQNNNFIFDILSKFLSYIFDVNHFVFLIFFGYLVFRIISFLCKKFGFSKQCVKSCLNKIKRKNKNIDKGSKYFDYAPIDLIDEYKSQEESKNLNDDNSTPYAEQFKELKSFLENDNVKNLAIFGSYGAGKSSFIKTFFNHFTVNNRREDDEVIYISLSDFDYINVSKKKNQSNKQQSESGNKTNLKLNKKSITIGKQSNYTKEDTLESNLDSKSETFEFDTCKLDLETVETEIIRQLVCSKISKKITVSLFSNFKSDLLEKLKIAFVIFCCISVILLCLNQHVEPEDFLSIDIYLFPKLSLLFLLIHFFIKYIFRRFRFSNISFFNIGVSAKDKSELSVFDAYLDEITYLFEESNCRYVVFEDLDRTENYEVLTHLRSLNFILNNDHRCIDNIEGNPRKIVFIYVIRSDIFNTAQETVKFFDASIHVQNVITKANSWEFFIKYRDDLRERFKDNLLKKEFLSIENLDDSFLSDIALFITDLRLVKMIFNDYLNILGSLEYVFSKIENINFVFYSIKIFSYAVFRAIYPNEYKNLIQDKGIIFDRLNRENSHWKKTKKFFDEVLSTKIQKEKSLNRMKDKSNADNEFSIIISDYLIDKPLLQYLIDNNFLSEDYRFYGALFSKGTFQKETYDLDFFSEIINLSDKYNPELKISNYIINVILQYFPNTPLLCNCIYNYDFFYSILHRIFTTYGDDVCKKFLENYIYCFLIEFASFSCSADDKRESYKNEVLQVYSFIVGLCDFIREHQDPNLGQSSKEICLWIFAILDKLADLSNSKTCGDSIFRDIEFGKFFAYTLNYYQFFSENEDDFLIYIKFNKEKIKQFLLRQLSFEYGKKDSKSIERTQNSVLSFVANDTYFVSNYFFQALKDLNIQFLIFPKNLSIDTDSNLKFIDKISNRYYLDEDNNIHFFFKENMENFYQISKYLRDKYLKRHKNYRFYNNINNTCQSSNKKLQNLRYKFLTNLFNIITPTHMKSFGTAFFRYLFVTNHYENFLNVINFPFYTEQQSYLNDSEEIVFFVTLMMSLSYTQNGAEKSEKDYASYLTIHNNQLKYDLEHYADLSNPALFDSIIYCFLDSEFQKINDLKTVIKKTIAYDHISMQADLTKDNIFSKWLNIYPGFDLKTNDNLYRALAKALSLLLSYSCLENKNAAIAPTINNVILIKNILCRQIDDNHIRIYLYKSLSNEYNLCWDSLSQFFYKYYKEIFASDKDKQYNLSSDFDKSPYNFDETKKCISSLKKKE